MALSGRWTVRWARTKKVDSVLTLEESAGKGLKTGHIGADVLPPNQIGIIVSDRALIGAVRCEVVRSEYGRHVGCRVGLPILSFGTGRLGRFKTK